MLGLIAALLAVYLGAFGPRFRWRGALLLTATAMTVGLVATVLAARDADARGLQFGVTLGSVLQGLTLQAAFMLTFYGMAGLAGWSARKLAPAIVEQMPRDADG